MPVVTYSLLRLGLFAAALLGLWLAGMGGWLLVVVATVVAAASSYVLLRRYQLAADRWIAERRAGGRPRFSVAVEEDAAVEDAADDAATDQSASPRPSSTP